MNVERFILKMSVVSLILLSNAISFGMIIRYKDKETKRRVQTSVTSCLEALEKKQLKTLPLEEQGRRNLEKLYKHRNNPKFVQKFLSDKDRHVPVMLVNCSIHFKETKGLGFQFLAVNPYREDFYPNTNRPWLSKEIIELGQEKLARVIEQKRTHCFPVQDIGNANQPLVTASLFGSNKEIRKELESNPCFNDIHYAVFASIAYPNQKNNVLELLLQKIKKFTQQQRLFTNDIVIEKQNRIIGSYQLLCSAINNREAFELVANKDPFNVNMLSMHRHINNKLKACTNFDIVVDNKEFFGQENIDIFRNNGGMTAPEIEQMEIVDKILKNLPSRRIPIMTLEEETAHVLFERITHQALTLRDRIVHIQQPDAIDVHWSMDVD